MRKEIFGILFFFLTVLTIISLLSFSDTDPSINNAAASEEVHNLFGVLGAHLAGLLFFLFGLGSFWVPVFLLWLSIKWLSNHLVKWDSSAAIGALILVIVTGSLLSIRQDDYIMMGNSFPASGIFGSFLKIFVLKYTNTGGGTLILSVLWIIGFILATRISLIAICKCIFSTSLQIFNRCATGLKWIHRSINERQKRKKIPKKIPSKRQIEIKAVETKPVIRPTPKAKQEVFDFMRGEGSIQLPSLTFLDDPDPFPPMANRDNLEMQSKLLEKKLEDFGVHGRVVMILPGPVITTFEYEPAPGIKINRVVNLSDDLAMALRAMSIRIIAPIPGKAAIGIEIPNSSREMVRFKDMVMCRDFEKSKSNLTICLGKDIVGNPVVTDLAKMPHLLIAGATGTGKSVGLNAMICSMLYKSGSNDIKYILIDPKRIELSVYDGIPHLITPVLTDVKKATNALYWAVKEMERRYELLSEKKVRNISQFNTKIQKAKKSDESQTESTLPYIVIVIDELADLMMVTGRDVEVALTRLAQMARAAGIHLILATQRPSVDVLTGIIKANFPTRLTFQVSSKTDSRTIIDTNGAEQLLGNGDMLFLPPGTAKLQRIHGAYISEDEISKITEFLRSQKSPHYDESITETPDASDTTLSLEDYDEKYDEAVALVTQTRQASISMVQRHLRIGYNRAARIIEIMEKEGIVGPADGAKPREVLVRGYD
jgi:S-DNA-T family DNA segregation ATPase FtsK/SpoIIIE